MTMGSPLLRVRLAAPWLVQRYRDPHAHVELHFVRVFAWEGEPVGDATNGKIMPFKLMRGRQAVYVDGANGFVINPNVFGPGSFWGVVQPKPAELSGPLNNAAVGDSRPLFAWKPAVIPGPGSGPDPAPKVEDESRPP